MQSPRNCYVCKAAFTRLHFFYDTMCPSCARLNYQKRFQTADLKGQVALITGSRLKIGYQATLMMLRAGATVIATTRFPVDASLRYSREKDFDEWGNRLHIYGLDLRHTPSVALFCSHLEDTYDRLDIMVNNAAQTVRRPPGFYAHLMQQVDLRTTNSWRLKLGEIQTAEMLEIQLINAVAPLVLCNKLAPLMRKNKTGQKHIVNVSAMEGKFMRFKKGERHPIPTWPKRRSIC